MKVKSSTGGQAATRGFLIQALVCLLDALKSDQAWIDVTIEPNDAHEKIDFVLRYPTYAKAIQVKSSENQFALSSVKAWADELRNRNPAKQFVLQHVGPCSKSVVELGDYNGVLIPTPLFPNLPAMFAHAGQLLHGHFWSMGKGKLNPEVSDVVAQAIICQLLLRATNGTPISRADLSESLYRIAKLASPNLIRPPAAIVATGATGVIRNDILSARNGVGIYAPRSVLDVTNVSVRTSNGTGIHVPNSKFSFDNVQVHTDSDANDSK